MTFELARAKINLFLNVENKRPDGFHNITTVMHEVPLFDTLAVECIPSDNVVITLISDSEELPKNDEDNLIVKAARAYLAKIGRCATVKIKLDKRIPISAGLAGGSADAAATLRALNRIFDSYFTAEELSSIAEQLGSDVPFCLVGGTALCRGRGEKLAPLASPEKLFVLIAKGEESVSTPVAYALIDEKYGLAGGNQPDAVRAYIELSEYLLGNRAAVPELYNIFESVIFDKCPMARSIKQVMLAFGATAALMSGSGPSVFGIFPDELSLTSASDALEAMGAQVYHCTPPVSEIQEDDA